MEYYPSLSSPAEEILARYNNVADTKLTSHERGQQRYGFLHLEKDGREYFGKYAKTSDTKGIQKAIWWAQTMITVDDCSPITTPPIVDHSETWYITPWVESKPSVAPNESPNKLDGYIDAYTDFLKQLDQHPPPLSLHLDFYEILTNKWNKWLKEPLRTKLIRSTDVIYAKNLIRENAAQINPGLQHGDFVPWHILHDKENRMWLIDAEHASFEKPRFYDIAYMYSRIFTIMKSPEHAKKLLRIFIHKISDEKESIYSLYNQFIPVLTSRAIGMHFDALKDYNKENSVDYRTNAQELLHLCLSNDPSKL